MHKAQSTNVEVIWLVKKYYLQQITQISSSLLTKAFPLNLHAFSYAENPLQILPGTLNEVCVWKDIPVFWNKRNSKTHHHLHIILLLLYKIPDISDTIDKLKYMQAAPVSLHVKSWHLNSIIHFPGILKQCPASQGRMWPAGSTCWIPPASGPCASLCTGSKVDGWYAASCSLNSI